MTWQHEYKKTYRETAPVARWTLKKVLLWGIGLSIVFGGLSIVTGVFSSAKGVMDRTLDPDNIIYNYEWFHSKNQAYISYKAQKTELKQQLSGFKDLAGANSREWSRAEREAYTQINNQLMGVAQHVRDIAAEYNARTGMANREIFKSGDLPDSLPIE